MKTLILICAASILPLTAQAQPTADVGKRIATQGVNGAPCLSCHGANGEGNAVAGFPRLAGLPAYYFAKQLHAFADGTRENPVMAPIAKALNKNQIDALATYYASLSNSATTGGKAPPAKQTLNRGRILASHGDENRMLQACANCHGAGGTGEPPVYPYLAGQHASYLENALREWKSGRRKTDASDQMPGIAQRLSDDDIVALATYYASLPSPSAAAQRTSVPPAAGSSRERGGAATAPTHGTGTEQGAGVTGGSQGPGGSDTGAAPRQGR